MVAGMALIVVACSHGEPSVMPAAPPLLPSAAIALETSPSPSPSPLPSSSPLRLSPMPTSPTGKTLDYYMARLPRFDWAPVPDSSNVDVGDRSPVWHTVPTTEPVAFLTIDDGAVQNPMALPLLEASGIRVTLFLTLNYARANPAYFRALQAAGAVIENHTITHTDLRGKSYDFQKHEICYTADQFAVMFGRRPTLFRPPYGDYDSTTLRVARECGQKVVVHWTETVDKGKVRYQTDHHTIQPGHIVLMHFRPAYADDFTAALIRMKQSGVRPALLEDYVQGACVNACQP
jgi:peptidoglycan/xylan/chitin deacetylase (PgdA/CDA1 family)